MTRRGLRILVIFLFLVVAGALPLLEPRKTALMRAIRRDSKAAFTNLE